LFTGLLPTFPENFTQIHMEVFLRKAANRQTDKQQQKHILVGGGNVMVICHTAIFHQPIS